MGRRGLAFGFGHRRRRTIDEVPAARETFPGPAPLARLAGRIGLSAFVVFLVIGVALDLAHPALAATGAAVGLLAGVPLFLVRPRFLLGYAAAGHRGGGRARGRPIFRRCLVRLTSDQRVVRPVRRG